ncbi:hypothetical protein [Streptomyces sp. NPDC001165]|uniref:hypothetical protein n=1 Tax=Streptomyces sp. NPDC001165 TaxID=3364546 RepID=UPI0036B6C430
MIYAVGLAAESTFAHFTAEAEERGVLVRVADLAALQQDRESAQRWRWLTTALAAWLDHIPGLVVNRPSIRSDNGSKPLHERSLSQAGFRVPASITSSSPQRLRAFARTDRRAGGPPHR